MNDSDTYIKTALGIQELKSRSQGLSMRLRSLLIIVDGGRTVAELRAAAAAMAVPPDFMEQLLQEGLIERVHRPAPAARARASAPMPLDSADAGPDLSPASDSPPQSSTPTDAERFVVLQKLMIETAAEGLGLRSLFFTLKLEKCYTLDDLRALMPELAASLMKSKGELKARALIQRLQMLSA